MDWSDIAVCHSALPSWSMPKTIIDISQLLFVFSTKLKGQSGDFQHWFILHIISHISENCPTVLEAEFHIVCYWEVICVKFTGPQLYTNQISITVKLN